MTRPVHLILFATAREAVGVSTLTREVPAGGVLLSALLAALVHEHPRLGPILATARFVRNGQYVAGDRVRVHPGDEIAIHPPYSGG